ncbi:hypothetical protein DL95DRAFT_393839 [Leptodontidium sp. 2 PMI_412]|nr:hypothetical protein DL95DRAFT_393839 [Leptodontidium sp. 2 PMI_412]
MASRSLKSTSVCGLELLVLPAPSLSSSSLPSRRMPSPISFSLQPVCSGSESAIDGDNFEKVRRLRRLQGSLSFLRT